MIVSELTIGFGLGRQDAVVRYETARSVGINTVWSLSAGWMTYAQLQNNLFNPLVPDAWATWAHAIRLWDFVCFLRVQQ
eukprot:scaffold166514_cov19-Prasinocladus_malaysianus.AAC.1